MIRFQLSPDAIEEGRVNILLPDGNGSYSIRGHYVDVGSGIVAYDMKGVKKRVKSGKEAAEYVYYRLPGNKKKVIKEVRSYQTSMF